MFWKSNFDPKPSQIISCLSPFGLPKKRNVIDWVLYKQKKFTTHISHSSRGWKVQNQDAYWSSIYWESPSWLIDSIFSLTSCVCGIRGLSQAFLIRALIPFARALPSWLNHIPKAPPPNTFILRVRIPTYELGEGEHKYLLHNTGLGICSPQGSLFLCRSEPRQ